MSVSSKASSSTDGVGASTIELPAGQWPTILDFLCEHFPSVAREAWGSRMLRGRVLHADGSPVTPADAYRVGLSLRYFRELESEIPIPFEAHILHRDAHLVVVDKPHFLPVVPSGRFARETLLARLRASLALDTLVPLHRIDRGTAGLVLFSLNPDTRGVYQQLFAQRRIHKVYEALAPALPHLDFPLRRCSRVIEGEPFFRSREVDGSANSETMIEVMESAGPVWHYCLRPITGRKHQLRVHLSALGAPIVNDPLYPEIRVEAPGDFSRPLKLLARALEFDDPLDGRPRRFESGRELEAQASGFI